MPCANVSYKEIPLKLKAAYSAAEKSDDRSTKNGAILVKEGWNVLTGWNHMMEGWGGELEHHERPFKYWITEHAERDVLLKAASKGICTKGMTLVANWVACPDCARAIVLAGIDTVICHKDCQKLTPERWKDMVTAGIDIMKQGGVRVIEWEGKIGGIHNIHNGELWAP